MDSVEIHHLKSSLERRILGEACPVGQERTAEGARKKPASFRRTPDHLVRTLTPAHFLIGREPAALPTSSGETPSGMGARHLGRRWRHQQLLMRHLWKRWTDVHLVSLNVRGKWKKIDRPPEVDDLVLVTEDTVPRNCWKLGVITELLPGSDGIVRSIRLRTARVGSESHDRVELARASESMSEDPYRLPKRTLFAVVMTPTLLEIRLVAPGLLSIRTCVHVLLYCLPRLELPKFDGDVTRFHEFWDQFETSVHRQPGASGATKLAYLRGCLTGAALDTIEGLSASNQGYELALQRLRERFDRPMVAVREQILRLVDLLMTKNKLSTICDEFHKKTALRKVLAKALVSREELVTILCEIEARINARPLTTISDDSNDLEPLTPFHFLTGRTLMELPDITTRRLVGNKSTSTTMTLRRRWYYQRKILRHLWQRWRKEYLVNFNSRQKWKTQKLELNIGDIVLLCEDGQTRSNWPMGRILELYPSSDGMRRSALEHSLDQSGNCSLSNQQQYDGIPPSEGRSFCRQTCFVLNDQMLQHETVAKKKL
ncbi:hypothetical protein T08_6859 [Trichinella sp. T8]|nr:hypothetical protein T08_6859 [Trichinella sp. T8]